MKRTVALPAKKVRNFAHKALKALGFVNLNPLFKRHQPVNLTADPIGLEAEVRTGSPAVPDALEQQSPGDRQISMENWDIMFRAIQLRLRQTVGDRLASAPPPQADDTAGHIQVAVLECVDAMGQLHAALAHGRT